MFLSHHHLTHVYILFLGLSTLSRISWPSFIKRGVMGIRGEFSAWGSVRQTSSRRGMVLEVLLIDQPLRAKRHPCAQPDSPVTIKSDLNVESKLGTQTT